MSEEVEIKDPKAVLDALERAKSDAKKYREQLEELQAEHAKLEKTNKTLEKTVKTYEEGGNEWKGRTKELMIKSSLGVKNPERVMKYLDLESIDFDEEGKLTGLEEAVSKVKAELPELFDTKKRVGGAADLFAKGDVEKKMTGTEMQVAKIFRRK